ncbi:hypothetical protein [Lysobacter gummosus]|uniref:hypothetical protein n=1 Tax=Lysobacter gummosus TaxID=262324 RepID=UPI0036458BFD
MRARGIGEEPSIHGADFPVASPWIAHAGLRTSIFSRRLLDPPRHARAPTAFSNAGTGRRADGFSDTGGSAVYRYSCTSTPPTG